MDLYTITHILPYLGINIIYIYAKHSFMQAFFKGLCGGYQRKYQLVLLSYYVAAIVSFLVINDANVNMAVGIICTFLMSLCFESKMQNRIIAVLFLIILGAGCEFITMFTFQFFSARHMNLQNSNIEMLVMVMISKVILLLIIKILEPFLRLMHHEKGVGLSQGRYPYFASYWASVLIIPISSIFIMHTIAYMAMNYEDSLKMSTVVCVFLILIINTIVFYLYDKLLDAYAIRMENALLTQQVEYHIEQYRQIRKEEELIFELRHNLKNQILGIATCLKSNNPNSEDEISKNANEIIGKIEFVNRTVHTGIEVIDTIINYKSAAAEDAETRIEVKSNLRQDYPVDNQVICIILGNALDNAIDACRELPQGIERVITIRVSEEKRSLYMSVKNPCNRQLVLKNGFPVTTKKEKSVHGIGLRNIDKTVKEFGGLVTFAVHEGFFELDVILYNTDLHSDC